MKSVINNDIQLKKQLDRCLDLHQIYPIYSDRYIVPEHISQWYVPLLPLEDIKRDILCNLLKDQSSMNQIVKSWILPRLWYNPQGEMSKNLFSQCCNTIFEFIDFNPGCPEVSEDGM